MYGLENIVLGQMFETQNLMDVHGFRSLESENHVLSGDLSIIQYNSKNK